MMRYAASSLVLCWASVACATIVWDYDSPLSVIEDVTDIGGGKYRYDYSFVNEDSLPITAFGVYTTFGAQPGNTFTGLDPAWELPYYRPMNIVASWLDGRNLDSAIILLMFTDNCLPLVTETVCRAETAIQPGQAVSGFSFTSSVYDASQKYYFYSTTDSGYVDSTYRVAAVGTTIPEPATLMLLGFGGLFLLKSGRAK